MKVFSLARKPFKGTIVQNVTQFGAGSLQIDQTRVPFVGGGQGGRWPSNLILIHSRSCQKGFDCVSSCPAHNLDQQSGIVITGGWVRHNDTAHPFGKAVGVEHHQWKTVEEPPGGASRYFKQIRDEIDG